MVQVLSFLRVAIKFMTVFLFGATGEIINQKSGHLNMGTPGIMWLGALGGLIGEQVYIICIPASSPLNPFLIFLIPALFAIFFGAIGGALFSFFTVTLHCNQNVTGLTLTTFATGLAQVLVTPITKMTGTVKGPRLAEAGLLLQSIIPESVYSKAGWFGEVFLSHSWFTVLAFVTTIGVAIFLAKTRVGLNLRAVGENAAAADSAGINVNMYRYLATIVGGAIAGLGGAFFELDRLKGLVNPSDGVDAFGWLALCIVIFAMWKPIVAIGASFLFSCLAISKDFFASMLKGMGWMSYVLQMSPYVFTLLVIIGLSIFQSKRNQPPANLGISYFREER